MLAFNCKLLLRGLLISLITTLTTMTGYGVTAAQLATQNGWVQIPNDQAQIAVADAVTGIHIVYISRASGAGGAVQIGSKIYGQTTVEESDATHDLEEWLYWVDRGQLSEEQRLAYFPTYSMYPGLIFNGRTGESGDGVTPLYSFSISGESTGQIRPLGFFPLNYNPYTLDSPNPTGAMLTLPGFGYGPPGVSGSSYRTYKDMSRNRYIFAIEDGGGDNDFNDVILAVDVGPANVGNSAYILNVVTTNGTYMLSPNESSYAPGTQVTITASANSGYADGTWGGDASGSFTGTSSERVITMDGNRNVSVSFNELPATPSYTLTVNTTNGFYGLNPGPVNGKYLSGTSVTITGSANPGYSGGAWSGFGDANDGVFTGVSTNRTFTILGDTTINIGFNALPSTTPPTANISTSAASIQVGQSATITATYSAGSNDSLSGTRIDMPEGSALTTSDAQASRVYNFTPASAGTYTFYARAITPNYGWASYSNVTVTVTNPPPTTYTLSVSGTNGTHTLSPAGGTYSSGTTVRITANANATYSGGSWGLHATGNFSGTSTTYDILMNGDKSVSYVFNPTPQAPTANITTTAAGNTIVLGQSVTINATFTNGAHDTISQTSIDMPAGTNLVNNTTAGNKSYNFTPTASGSYTFLARANTPNFPWATYASVTVTVTEAPKTINLSISPEAAGSVGPAASNNVAHGGSINITSTGNAGYTFLGWFDGVTQVSAQPNFTLSNVTANRTLVARYAPPAMSGNLSLEVNPTERWRDHNDMTAYNVALTATIVDEGLADGRVVRVKIARLFGNIPAMADANGDFPDGDVVVTDTFTVNSLNGWQLDPDGKTYRKTFTVQVGMSGQGMYYWRAIYGN